MSETKIVEKLTLIIEEQAQIIRELSNLLMQHISVEEAEKLEILKRSKELIQ